MALRFRKSIKLAPGVRLNFSGRGTTWSLGPRGASVSIGRRGVYANAGIPGTGISSRTRIAPAPAAAPRAANSGGTTYTMTCAVEDDGSLSFTDANGAPMAEHVVELAKKQNRAAILDLIQRQCDNINGQIEALGQLHHDTPAPIVPRFEDRPFPEPPPSLPPVRQVGLLARLIPGRSASVTRENEAAALRHRDAVETWERDRADYEHQAARQKVLVEKLIYEDAAAMEQFLEQRLAEITWPRETTVSLDIRDAGATVALDVDLPEIEDMPTRLAAVPARGLKLSVKELPPTKVQKLYAAHVHGIAFRLVGEAFAALPRAEQVTVAGYSQRRDPATAQLRDDYLVSVRADRAAWGKFDFEHLDSLDPADALAAFDLRRDMAARTGILKPIVPHS